jgi:hypothetical protein
MILCWLTRVAKRRIRDSLLTFAIKVVFCAPISARICPVLDVAFVAEAVTVLDMRASGIVYCVRALRTARSHCNAT